jgi:hypothetical protein
MDLRISSCRKPTRVRATLTSPRLSAVTSAATPPGTSRSTSQRSNVDGTTASCSNASCVDGSIARVRASTASTMVGDA